MSAALRALGLAPVETGHAAHGTFRVAGAGGILPLRARRSTSATAGTAARFLTALGVLLPPAAACTGSMESRPCAAVRWAACWRRSPRSARSSNFSANPAVSRSSCTPPVYAAVRSGSTPARAARCFPRCSTVAPLAAAPLKIKLVGEVRWPFVAMMLRQMAQFGQPTAAVRPARRRSSPCRGAGPSSPRPRTRSNPTPPPPPISSRSPSPPAAACEWPACRRRGRKPAGDLAFAGELARVGLQLRREAGARLASAPLRGIDADFNTFSDTFLNARRTRAVAHWPDNAPRPRAYPQTGDRPPGRHGRRAAPPRAGRRREGTTR